MKDEKVSIRLVESLWPEGEARWCDRPRPIDIPGRPELGLFPDMLTWHYGNSLVERPYVRTVTYVPLFFSLRRMPDGKELEMKYQSVHDPGYWISFRAAVDGSLWRAEHFRRGDEAGTTVARPGVQFFILFALQGIADDEKHFSRDWPVEEIAAMRKLLRPEAEPSSEPPTEARNAPPYVAQKEITDLPAFCAWMLKTVQELEGVGRTKAASMLIEVLRCELAAGRPGSKPN
jgi:hypothetical protein